MFRTLDARHAIQPYDVDDRIRQPVLLLHGADDKISSLVEMRRLQKFCLGKSVGVAAGELHRQLVESLDLAFRIPPFEGGDAHIYVPKLLRCRLQLLTPAEVRRVFESSL